MATLAPSFFDSIFFVLAGIEDLHKCLDEFEFQEDLATDNGIICPWASQK